MGRLIVYDIQEWYGSGAPKKVSVNSCDSCKRDPETCKRHGEQIFEKDDGTPNRFDESKKLSDLPGSNRRHSDVIDK